MPLLVHYRIAGSLDQPHAHHWTPHLLLRGTLGPHAGANPRLCRCRAGAALLVRLLLLLLLLLHVHLAGLVGGRARRPRHRRRRRLSSCKRGERGRFLSGGRAGSVRSAARTEALICIP